MRATGKPLSQLASVVQACPQLLKSVRVKSKVGWEEDAGIREAIEQARRRLGSAEWLSVRASGTEPLIRVMAQGTDEELVNSVVHDISAVIEARLGR
jgi:phosphoglucosamine mutase